MESVDIFSTAAESLPIEAIEPIEPSDLTVSNLQRFLESLLPAIRSLAFNIVVCIVIYLIGNKLIKLADRMTKRALERTQADPGLIRFLGSAVDFALRVFLISMILGQLGVNTASVVTVLGTLMLAIGMSLQGSLANVAGGILLLITHPFRVGHYIICDYGEGTVTSIGLVYTILTTKDNCVLTIPNSEISNCAVTNCGENPQRRVDLITGIGYSSDLRRAKEILREISEGCQYVLKDRPVSVFVDSLGDSSVNLGLFCYVSSADYLAAKWELTEAIKLRFDEEGIEIPFPQMDVHMCT
ncbi:MAG: mechanosensitive ion channel [Eubacteriales bacterium]|nr:mechanosensitive ion channel [Eubacteriales bacterium]